MFWRNKRKIDSSWVSSDSQRSQQVALNDKRVLWDWIKYRIRQVSIKYSKEKAGERKGGLATSGQKVKQCDLLCNSDPSEKNMYDLDAAKYEYELLLDYIVRGNIVTSRINWYEKGEKIRNISLIWRTWDPVKQPFAGFSILMEKLRLTHKKNYG